MHTNIEISRWNQMWCNSAIENPNILESSGTQQSRKKKQIANNQIETNVQVFKIQDLYQVHISIYTHQKLYSAIAFLMRVILV